MSAAKLFASILESRADDAVSRDTAAKTVSALASVEDIIEALLDISRLDSGQAIMNVQDVGLGDILTSLRSELTPLAEEKGLKLRLLDSNAQVRSDPVFLRRILQNLVINAIRYTDRGQVLVGVRRAGAQVRVDVHDTGAGIAAQDQRIIFGEFKRLAPSMSGSKGIGLGLAIVDRACQSLGHKLNLRSALGNGSCFSVLLDRATGFDVAPGGTPRSTEAHPSRSDLVVLLVENDLEVAGALSLMIEGWGNHVVHAETGEDALALLEEVDLIPDCLLLDYQLGTGMTGLDLLTYLRSGYGMLPVRIISANRTPALLKACARQNVGLLQKPLDAGQLIDFLDAPPVAD